jgi:hypothetical protein
VALSDSLWRRARLERARSYLASSNRGAKARFVLRDLLARAGYRVSLVTVHGWSREQQGEAYLWAISFVDGREDLPAPQFVRDAPPRWR